MPRIACFLSVRFRTKSLSGASSSPEIRKLSRVWGRYWFKVKNYGIWFALSGAKQSRLLEASALQLTCWKMGCARGVKGFTASVGQLALASKSYGYHQRTKLTIVCE